MIKIKKISPVKLMMDHWLEIPGLKGDVGCTSLVTCLAKNLGLLEDASITYIDTLHRLIDYNYFNHAHILRKLVMMYVDYTTEILLSNRNLSLYVVDSLIFDLQRKEEAPCQSASVRITRSPQP